MDALRPRTFASRHLHDRLLPCYTLGASDEHERAARSGDTARRRKGDGA